MRLKVELKDKEFSETIKRLQALSVNMKPVFHNIGKNLLSNWRLHWKREENPYGEKWHPLSKVTLARKLARKNDDNPKILRENNRLLDSYTVKATDNSVEIGTNVVYAKTHQFGAKKGQFGFGKKRKFPIPWGDIPARKMLPDMGLPREDIETIYSAIEEAVNNCLRR